MQHTGWTASFSLFQQDLIQSLVILLSPPKRGISEQTGGVTKLLIITCCHIVHYGIFEKKDEPVVPCTMYILLVEKCLAVVFQVCVFNSGWCDKTTNYCLQPQPDTHPQPLSMHTSTLSSPSSVNFDHYLFSSMNTSTLSSPSSVNYDHYLFSSMNTTPLSSPSSVNFDHYFFSWMNIYNYSIISHPPVSSFIFFLMI